MATHFDDLNDESKLDFNETCELFLKEFSFVDRNTVADFVLRFQQKDSIDGIRFSMLDDARWRLIMEMLRLRNPDISLDLYHGHEKELDTVFQIAIGLAARLEVLYGRYYEANLEFFSENKHIGKELDEKTVEETNHH